jgi:hypothetical protein
VTYRHTLAVLCLLSVPCLARAEPPSPETIRDARNLAGRIDRLLAEKWSARGVQSAPPADDPTFIRRVYLDLAGRIPTILEVRDFLDDDRPDKRAIWVEQLLASDRYAEHFANVWRAVLLPYRADDGQSYLGRTLAAWLRNRLRARAGYDEIVRELLTAPVQGSAVPSPVAFYQANEQKPENLAASTARLFLGIRLECARCHAHPFASWKREHFWEFAAFFAGVGGQDRRQIAIPDTDKVVKARFPDGSEPIWQSSLGGRADLAGWLTAAENPYFARAAVNQMWAYFFGTGLVEPVDAAGDGDPASHPELLDDLAREFASHRFDLRFLTRAIVLSRAYQRASTPPADGPDDPRLFTRTAARGLTPEQLFDSLAEVLEYREPPHLSAFPFGSAGPATPRQQFIARFAGPERSTESPTSILQALLLMNGRFLADATDPDRNPTLASIADSSVSTPRRIETLYLVALSRKPRPDEAARLARYVESGGPARDPRKALADVLWALLNSSEFVVNH